MLTCCYSCFLFAIGLFHVHGVAFPSETAALWCFSSAYYHQSLADKQPAAPRCVPRCRMCWRVWLQRPGGGALMTGGKSLGTNSDWAKQHDKVTSMKWASSKWRWHKVQVWHVINMVSVIAWSPGIQVLNKTLHTCIHESCCTHLIKISSKVVTRDFQPNYSLE